MWGKRDDQYWLAKERAIAKNLVDVADYGFFVRYNPYRRGWTDETRCRIRKGAAEALVKARQALPRGLNFIVFDGWRPWSFQKKAAARVDKDLRKNHPDWSEAQLDQQLWAMAPPARIVPRLGSHRYGGAFDLTLATTKGKELDLGVPVGHVTGPEAQLLFYEFIAKPTAKEILARDHRRLLIQAMTAGGFDPYLEEFWHWNYLGDVSAAAREWQRR